ncbi:MAG: indole-3-glycerol phosphate synthase TrpC [Dehalococcoidia bacterium]|nr:indole-3-glycerol phosphate synthase TrpC [Dehalococcoidia bacterium]
MSEFLSRIVADRRADLAEAMRRLPLEALRARCAALPPALDFAAPFRRPGVQLIAEIKRTSPAKGRLNAAPDPVALARAYAEGGAAAISVLTEPRHFHGSLDDLAAVRTALPAMPLLRKDFLLDPYQVWEGRAAGADAVLVIVAIVDDALLCSLLETSRAAGVAALVEVNTPDEVARAVAAGAAIIGINNRNLRTFEVDLRTTERLRPLIPPDRIVLSLSAIATEEDVRRLIAWGVDGMLVGETLMRSGDPRRTAAKLTAWGQAGVTAVS